MLAVTIDERLPVRAPKLYAVNRVHLDEITGELGIFQHAIGSTADPSHGYCVDDVGRALEVDLLHARTLPWAAVSESAFRSLRFLEDAFDETTGRFRNFRATDGSWNGERPSDDSFARAMLGLAAASAAPDADLASRAMQLFDRALPKASRLTAPRAAAAIVIACSTGPDPARFLVMRKLATELHARFITYARPGWPWPEDELTYETALLPRALIVAGQALKATTMVRVGLQVLDWLIDVQTAPRGHFSPVGNGWWTFQGERSQFDQQPLEATSLLLASEAALEATGNPRYQAAMEGAYAWFLGANDTHRRVADPARGACRDGLTRTGVNANEGAESTLMWLIALEHMRARRPGTGPRS
jgi:hypothetical protein